MDTLSLHQHEHVQHIILNVGGTRFETFPQILKKIPATRLSRLTKNLANYDSIKNEYYFDRHPGVFSQILNYYRTGKLHYPQCVCGPLFEEELVFWGIDSNQVEPCCWKTYTKHRQTEETLMTLEKLNIDVLRTAEAELNIKFSMDQEPGYPDNLSKFKQIQPKVWQMFEEPRSSMIAKAIASVQVLMICLSVVSLWFQSYPMSIFHALTMESQMLPEEVNLNFNSNETLSNSTINCNSTCNYTSLDNATTTSSTLRIEYENPVSIWLILLDYITLLWFLFDFGVRFCFSPDKNAYFMRIDNAIDVIATFWLILDIIFNFYITSFYIHAFQIIRVFRLFRLFSYHPGLKVIILSVYKSSSILNLLLLVLMILSTMFGAFIFYLEKLTTDDPNNNLFISIPDSFWFSLVSLTTIGYGDISPVTLLGRLIGAFCVCIGVIMIGLPMSIVVEVFSEYYKHLNARSKMPKERRRICPVEAPRARKKAQQKSTN